MAARPRPVSSVRTPRHWRAPALLVLALLVGWTALAAAAPAAQFRLGGGQPYVGMPVQLDLVVEGLAESPAPDQPALGIPGVTVTPLGVTPDVRRMMQIVNGRRTDSVQVTWVLRWRLEVSKAGRLRIPATTVVQGATRVTAPAGEVDVETVPTSDAMKLAVELPQRPVFVGETVPVTLAWTFRAQPQDQSFSVPMLSGEAFTASAPPATDPRARTITLSAGARDLQLPYTLDEVDIGGVRHTRLTATLFVAPRQTGSIAIPPAAVVAALPVGRADFFGNAPTRLFRATDIARTLEVKALPESGRPPTFAGAVGDQFSIEVRTSRSVVSRGEPVDLDVTVKSNQPLDALSLGKLDGEGRLPRDKFSVPAEPPTGELADQGKTKRFKITAQVIGPATEIPALAFSYFDPVKGAYQTIHSEPIALSVRGSAIVGAGDVVSGTRTTPGAPTAAPVDDGALVNAELALSSVSAAQARPIGGMLLWLLVGLLHAIPLALFALRTWQLRTRDARDDAAEVRLARRRVDELLVTAATAPARDTAGPLGGALRELARVLGRAGDEAALLARIETEAFSPTGGQQPLSAAVRTDAAGLVRGWLAEAKRRPAARSSAALALLVATAALAAPRVALAGPLEDGRAAYQEAMTQTGAPTLRRAAFARAATSLAEAARALPGRPELLADWGNAALGGGDVATATLAYRRALAIDATSARAGHNLAWLRSRQPDAFRPRADTSATTTLLFFHAWPRAHRLLVGAAAFACVLLLLVPWGGRRRGSLTGLAALPFIVWIAMVVSVVLEDRHADDAVVMDDVVMRAADSAGAPATLGQPVPRGAEVTIVEARDAWTRIRIASGATGWIPGGAIERVAR